MGPLGQLVHVQRHLRDRKDREMEALYRRKLFSGREESSAENLHLRRVLERVPVILTTLSLKQKKRLRSYL